MSHVLLLDTNVWSHLILGEENKRQKVQADLDALLLKYPGAARATSRICVAECLVAARRLLDPAERAAAEAAFAAEFDNPQLIIVEVSKEVADVAATQRAEILRRVAAVAGGAPAGPDGGRLKLPDAFIAASCLDFNPPAILVTENEVDFRYVEDGIQKTVAGLIVEKIG
ncbi:MAG: PIN domain-containing protein [Polaromonas sp.]|nr:PIN domain-containing protein [Polaromonas sp.]